MNGALPRMRRIDSIVKEVSGVVSPASSSAAADDPVFKAAENFEPIRNTGHSAFAEYDG